MAKAGPTKAFSISESKQGDSAVSYIARQQARGEPERHRPFGAGGEGERLIPGAEAPPIRRLLSTTHTSSYRECWLPQAGSRVHDELLCRVARP